MFTTFSMEQFIQINFINLISKSFILLNCHSTNINHHLFLNDTKKQTNHLNFHTKLIFTIFKFFLLYVNFIFKFNLMIKLNLNFFEHKYFIEKYCLIIYLIFLYFLIKKNSKAIANQNIIIRINFCSKTQKVFLKPKK
jgi:hypothetical protein